MEKLEQALAFANYQSTLSRERTLLKQRFADECVLAYAGGLFKLTPEFILAIDSIDCEWVLDLNGNPVKIVDKSDFLEQAKTTYKTAITSYGESYQVLRTKRNVKSLVGL
jgi:hypothetical protein